MSDLARFMTAMVTPYDASNEVDYKKARVLANHLVRNGNDGLVLAGTTGEAPLLSDEEKERLWTEVKDEVGPERTIVAGSGTVDTHHSIELAKRAERARADALLVVTPYYLKPSQEGIYQHVRAIAESTSLPIIVYNIPGRTGVNISIETMLRVAELPNVVGDKEANGDMEYSAKLIEQAPGFRIWSGNDSDNFLLWCLGAYGAVSVTGHITGPLQRKMMAHVDAGEIAEAAAIHRSLVPVTNACFMNGNPSTIRYALRKLGFEIGVPRLPVVEPDETMGALVMEELAKHALTPPRETPEVLAATVAGGT
ncbi:MAG: 4-hydroxy-tetrahydrodipicolinate synthase [Dehalococcoidia bacterium]|nr:4-hydroxy-tetrahydrodipicolinate synthase [Dehalococcoidia bacterium]MCA9826439.1 4-hydroxy-tetrahydrodipicolinate synthase [Dehalococcoidia bacterium]MCA9845368.1 4-hydroxy-tetrahydrodipicolinate synthase [Dehalococcoidia bacterium]